MIILATAIILALDGSGIIGKAREAKIESNIANAKELLTLSWAEWELMTGEEREANGGSFVVYARNKLKEAGFSDDIIERLDISENGTVGVIPDLTNAPVLAASDTWYTQGGSTVKRNTITSIEIKDSYTPSGAVTASWDASAKKDGSIMAYVEGTKLTLAGNGYGLILANEDASYMFSDKNLKDTYSSLKTITGLNIINLSKTTTVADMFDSCAALESATGLNKWNMGKVTNTSYMFWGCKKLTSLDIASWNVENVENMQRMFYNCNSLNSLNLSSWDVGKVTSMKAMFSSKSSMKLSSIGDTSKWDTTSCTNMMSMFQYCNNLSSLDVSKWDTSKVTDMSFMFAFCENINALDVSEWDTSKVTTMESLFYQCKKVPALDVSSWDTSSCTNMKRTFEQCFSLRTLDVSNWKTGKVTTFNNMFAGLFPWDDNGFVIENCMQIQKLDTSKWDTSSATDMGFMFYACYQCDINITNWNVSKVKNFDHFLAHSGVSGSGVDTSRWLNSVVENMNAMFHSAKISSIDLSGFTTSNVKSFGQMFENNVNLTEIKGLNNFNTSNTVEFSEMFKGCEKLTKLDLSSFDTRKAKDGVEISGNGTKSSTTKDMFEGMIRLKEIKLGANFSFNGDGTTTVAANIAVLPTPDSSQIAGADGNWYNEAGTPFAPANVPNKTAGTYYAVKP